MSNDCRTPLKLSVTWKEAEAIDALLCVSEGEFAGLGDYPSPDRLTRLKWLLEQHPIDPDEGTFTDATEEMLYQVWRNRSGEEA